MVSKPVIEATGIYGAIDIEFRGNFVGPSGGNAFTTRETVKVRYDY